MTINFELTYKVRDGKIRKDSIAVIYKNKHFSTLFLK